MFGMGTGGSLRLLSPETKRSLDSFAAACSCHPVGHERPPVCLCSDSRFLRSSVSHSSHAFRTLKTAQARDLVSSDQDSTASLLETFPLLRFRVFHKPLAPGFIGLRFHWISFPCDLSHALLIPNPYSLIPSLKIKPSTD